MTNGNLYDYRVMVESMNGAGTNLRLLSSDKIEEGQIFVVRGQRCLVSNVAPDPQIRPDEAQIIFVHCIVVDEPPG